jgi:hypothetical protein
MYSDFQFDEVSRGMTTRFVLASRLLLMLAGIGFLVWALTTIKFRDIEGFPSGRICLPVAVGIALLILAAGLQAKWGKSSFLLSLALVGQAVSLQLIDAGHRIRYQHYRPIGRLLTEVHPSLLIFLVLQTALVIAGLWQRRSQIRLWLKSHWQIWHLVAVGAVFVVASAAVQREFGNYISDLLLATVIQTVSLGNILLLAWSLPAIELRKLESKARNFFARGHEEGIDRFVILATCWVTLVAAVLSFFIYQHHPHVPDEVMYFYQARYFAAGHLSNPAPPVPEGFSFYMVPWASDRWYSILPPGWPAVLALGFLFGAGWLVNPVLAGFNVILAYLLVQKLYSQRTARMTLLLLCFSPWFIFMSMNLMNHTLTLTCTLLAGVAMLRARTSDSWLWALISGGAVGMVSLIRPLDGFIVAALLGSWAIGLGGKRLKVSSLTAFVVGALMLGVLVLPYNKHYSGSFTKFPLEAYYEKYYPHQNFGLGFGANRGLGWALDAYPGHSPLEAAINSGLNLFSLNTELLGWSMGSLLVLLLFLFSRRLITSDYLMVAAIVVNIAVYSLFWYSGGPDFGARYWYLIIVPCLVLTVRGIHLIQDSLRTDKAGSSVAHVRVLVTVLLMCFLTLANYFPWRVLDKYHHYLEMRPDILQLAQQHKFGSSLVLIRGNDHPDYESAWTYNPLDPQARETVYAFDRDPETRSKLLLAYSDRMVWVVDGPTLTGSTYKVSLGPVRASDLLLGQR